MQVLDMNQINGANIGQNVFVECDELIYCGNFFIEDNVRISAKKIYFGSNAKIERDTKINGMTGKMDLFSMGDESLIGFNSQILVPHFMIGDYTKIFNSSLCSGYKPITVGHNCWVGQSSILNSAETLTIGNNVRMGGNSQIWTHVASGELLEGCKFYAEKPVTLEDNVWLMGFGHTISPGVVLGKNTIVMSGSVVSKSTIPFHTYSGIPALDVTDKLNGWSEPSLQEKFQLLKTFVHEFRAIKPEFFDKILCLDLVNNKHKEQFNKILTKSENLLVFVKKLPDLHKYRESVHSIFDLSTKFYLKKRSVPEINWMQFATGYRARFIPF